MKRFLMLALAAMGLCSVARADVPKLDCDGRPYVEPAKGTTTVAVEPITRVVSPIGAQAAPKKTRMLLTAGSQPVAGTKPASKVLFWRPHLASTENARLQCVDHLRKAYEDLIPSSAYFGSKYPSGIGVDVFAVNGSSGSVDLPASLDEYALVFVVFPGNSITSAQVEKLKSVVARGGRVVLQGEHGSYSPTENAKLTELAKNMGVHFEILSGSVGSLDTQPTDWDIYNRKSDLLKEDLLNNTYPRSACVAPIGYSGIAQEVMRVHSGSQEAVWAVDEASGNGRITAFSDVNWYMNGTKLLTNAIPFLERLYDNAIACEQKVIDEENPNEDIEEKIPDWAVAAVRDKNSYLTYYETVAAACTAASSGYGVADRLTVVLKRNVGESFTLPEGVTFETTDITTNYTGTISVSAQCQLVVNATHDVYKSVRVYPPETPTVTASKGTYSDRVQVSWSKPNSKEPITAYELVRVKVGSTLETVLTNSFSGTSYSDTSARSGIHYTYYVRARSSAGWGFAGSDEGWRSTSGQVPDSVLWVTASAGTETNGVVVTWQPDTNSAIAVTHYQVRRAPKGTDDWTTLSSTVDPSATSYTDSGTDAGVEYVYEVLAGNDNGWSAGVRSGGSGWQAILLELDPASWSPSYGATNLQVAVTANTGWTVSSRTGVATVSTTADGLDVSLPANTTLSDRAGTVTVTAGGSTDHPVSKTFAYTQSKRPPKPTKLEIESGPTTLEGGSNGTFKVVATFDDGSKRDVTADATWTVRDGGKYGSFDAPGHLTTKETTDLAGRVVVGISYENSDYVPVTLTAETTVDVTFSTRLKRPVSISISGPETVRIAETGSYAATVRYNNGDEADVTLAADAAWSVAPARPVADLKKGGASWCLTPYAGGTNVVLTVVYAETCGKTPSGDEPVEVSDSLTVTVPGAIPLPIAVDAESLVFATGGSTNGVAWYGQDASASTHDGIDAAQSGRVFGAGKSWMSTTVTNAGDVSFWWKASCEPTYDSLTFAVDGDVRAQTSGTTNGWQRLEFEIPGGTHTLSWTYAKDGRNDVGEDCGWVDQLVWNPLPAPASTTGGVVCASIRASDGTSTDFIEVEWSPFDSRRPVLEYELSRAEKGTSDWTVLSTNGVLRYVDAAAEPGVDYTYRVRARNDAGWGEWISDDGWRAYSLSVGATEIEVGCGAATNDLPVGANADWEIDGGSGDWLTAEKATATNATLAVGGNGFLDARTSTVTVSVGGTSPHATNVTVAVTQAGRPPVIDVGFVKPDENWRTRLQVATNAVTVVADGVYAPVSVFTSADPLDISFGWTNRSEVAVAMPPVRFRLYAPNVAGPVSEWTVGGRADESLDPGQSAWSGHWPFESLAALRPGDYRLEAELAPGMNDANRDGDVDGDRNDNVAIFRFAVRNAAMSLAEDVFGAEGWTKLEVMPGNDFAQVPHAAERIVGDGVVAHSAPAVQFGPYVPMNGVKVTGSSSRKALDLVLLIDDSISMGEGIAGLVKNVSVMVDQLLKGDANNDPVSDLRIKVVGFYDYKDYDFYGGITRPWFQEYPFSTDADELKRELAYLRDHVSGGSANDGESSYDALYYVCKGWTQDTFVGKPRGYQPTEYGFRDSEDATRVVLIFTDEPPHVEPFEDKNHRECNVPGCEGLTLRAVHDVLKEAGVHLMIVGDGLYQGDMGTYTNGHKYRDLVEMDPDTRKMVEPEPQDRRRGALAKMTGDADFIRSLAGEVSSRVVTKVTKVEPTLTASVKGSGVLTFRWCNKSTAGEKNTFSFECDGGMTNLVNRAGTGWASESLRLENGSHTFKWSYGKVDYEGSVSDCGLVGDIVWEPDRTQLSIDPKFFSIDHRGAWDEHDEATNAEDVVTHVGEGDQKVRVTCNSSWTAVTNGVPDWITFVAREGVGDGEIVFQVATNETYETRRATVVVRADECALDATNAYVEQEFRIEQKPSPYVENGKIQLLTVGVKPRWPWNEWVDIDFRVMTPEKSGTPVRVSFVAVNEEGGDLVDKYPTLLAARECKVRYNLMYQGKAVSYDADLKKSYIICPTSGIYRVSWSMSRDWYNVSNTIWPKETDCFHTPALSVRAVAERSGYAKVELPSAPVRVDMRQTSGSAVTSSGGAILSGTEMIGHPTGFIDPVPCDSTSLANGWVNLDKFYTYGENGCTTNYLEDRYVIDESGKYINGKCTNRYDRACVINDARIEGGIILTTTVWRADSVHVVRDNVFVHPKAKLIIEESAVVKFCNMTRIYIHRDTSKEGLPEEYNIVVEGAEWCGAFNASRGGNTLRYSLPAGDTAEWNGKDRIYADTTSWIDQNNENGTRAVINIALERFYGHSDGTYNDGTTYCNRYYSRGQAWGVLPRPAEDGMRFYGWYRETPSQCSLLEDKKLSASKYPDSVSWMVNPEHCPMTDRQKSKDGGIPKNQIFALICPTDWADALLSPVNARNGRIVLSLDRVVYDGTPHRPDVSSLTVGGAQVATSNYVVAYGPGDYVSADKYSVGVDFLTSDYVNSPTNFFTIEPRSIEGGEILFSDPTNGVMYLPLDRGAKKPTVTVHLPEYMGFAIDDEIATRDAVISDLESTDPEDHVWPEVGEYRVVASYEGNPNYTGGALTNVFRVSVNPDYVFTEYDSLEDAKRHSTDDKYKGETPRIIRFSGREGEVMLDYWKDLIRGNTKLNDYVSEHFVCWADTTNAAPSIGVRSLKDDARDIVTADGVMTAAELLKFFRDAFAAPELPTDASDAALTLSGVTLAYDGTSRRPTVTVTLGGETIASGDYDLVWSGDGIDVGEYSVSAVFNGKSYMGETASVAYEVVPRALTASDVSFDPESAVYDGTMHKPSVGTGGIPCAVDYGTGDFAAVGDYPVTATASGNCTGTVTKVFRVYSRDVVGAVIELDAASAEVKRTKSGALVDVRPHVLSVRDAVRTYAEGDYDVVYSEPTFATAGVYTVSAVFKGGYVGSASVTFEVTEAAEAVVAILGDDEAVVEPDGDQITVKPSDKVTAVVVDVPDGVDKTKVTVELSAAVKSVKPNGVKVKVFGQKDAMGVPHDITDLLVLPAADADGVVDLTKATVVEEAVEEILDPKEKDTVIELGNPDNPELQTVTRKGLFYQLFEGQELGKMTGGDSTVGDGTPWSPKISVKGGKSAFYRIGVAPRK